MKRSVTQTHEATYADPIDVAEGDVISLSGREDSWEGHRWLWAVAADGREVWVPADLPCSRGNLTVAAYDYAARELTVVPDETVNLLHVSHGWAWCRRETGGEGWIPESVLAS